MASRGHAGQRVFWCILALDVLLAVLLAAPGHTVSGRYLNDLMVLLDGAHRIASGQIPHLDFHTPMGALTLLIPAVGYWLTHDLGTAMPAGLALVVLLLAPLKAYVLSSRLRPALALPFALYLGLLTAAPLNPGENPTLLTFAMFYNRLGWVELALLVCLALPPQGARRDWLDGVIAAVLALLLLYLKVTYGLVALGLLALLFVDRERRRLAAIAILATCVIAAFVEIASGVTSAYAADVLQAIQSTGAVKGGMERLIAGFERNAFDFAVFAGVLLFAWLCLRDVRLVVFAAVCGAAGMMIMNQNHQMSGIVLLAAAAVVVSEAVLRYQHVRLASIGAAMLPAMLMLPIAVDAAWALGLHVAGPPGVRLALPALRNVVIPDNMLPEDRVIVMDYVAAVEDGASALRRIAPAPAKITVLDFGNPFSAALGLAPARGDHSVSDFGRTYDRRHFIPADVALGDSQIVMIPKRPLDPRGTAAYVDIYGEYLSARFALAADTGAWQIYLRKQ